LSFNSITKKKDTLVQSSAKASAPGADVPLPSGSDHDPAAAAGQIRDRIGEPPALALVLGSGFAPVLAQAQIQHRLDYAEIPGFPLATVTGHAGQLVAAHLGTTPVLILSGRVHFYEGHDLTRVTFAVRTLAALGVRSLVLTNAAGGIRADFAKGDFMVLNDHINFMGANPLRGSAWPGRERFLDLTQAYDPQMSEALFRAGVQVGLSMRRGVYLAVSGPSYETPAEIRAFERLGADAVGMSTVPETIVARHCGMRVAAVSCITNLAAGRSASPLSHQEVMETGEIVGRPAGEMLLHFAQSYGSQ
jgi:purine-nucleoside phosphorylase